MPGQDTYVAIPDGRYVRIPAGTAPEQLAMLRNRLQQFARPSDPLTAQTQDAAKAAGAPTGPDVPKFMAPSPAQTDNRGRPLPANIAAELRRQEKVAQYQNFASNSPTPVTNAILMLDPIPAKALTDVVDTFPSAARAGRGYEAVRAVVGKSPVEVTDAIGQRLSRLQQLKDAGNAMPMAVRKLILRVKDADKGPLTYDEARDFYTTLSRLSANERMALVPQVSREVGSLVGNLGQTIERTAQSGGQLGQYLRAMQEYRRLSLLRDARTLAMKAASKTWPYVATGTAVGGAIEGARRYFAP